MRVAAKAVLLVTLAAFLSSSLMAEDKDKKPNKSEAKKTKEKQTKKPAKKKQAKKKKAPTVVRVPKGIELTAEQKEAVANLNKEYLPKVTDARKKLSEVMTTEQKKALAEARKTAKKEGTKGKKLPSRFKPQ